MRPITLALSPADAGPPLPALRPTLAVPSPQSVGVVAVSVAACASLALLVIELGAPVVLAALVALGAIVVLFARPDWATVLFAVLVYLNVPVLLNRQAGVPRAAASTVVLLLGIPFVRLLLGRKPLRIDRTFTWMLLYLAVLLVSMIGARSLPIAAGYVTTFALEGVVLYVLIVNVVRTRAALRQAVWGMVAAGALLGALSTWQELGGSFEQQFGGLAQRNYEYLQLRELAEQHPEFRADLQTFSGGGRSRRAGGPVSEPNRFAQILIVLLPLAAWLFRTSASGVGRFASVACGAAVMGGLLFTDSRGAFLMVVVLAGVAMYVGWLRPIRLAAGAAVLAVAVPAVAPRAVERAFSIATASDLASGGDEADGAIRGRAPEMIAATQAFLDHPLVGVGPGQYTPMYSADYHLRAGGLKFRHLPGPRRAHSLYLEMAAELGVIGLGVFLAIVGALMRELWRVARAPDRDRRTADLATAWWLALLAYLGTAMFLHLSYVRYYWLLIAFASAALHVIRDGSRETAVSSTEAPCLQSH